MVYPVNSFSDNILIAAAFFFSNSSLYLGINHFSVNLFLARLIFDLNLSFSFTSAFELTEELLPIYEALLESLGKLSNDELARILWKEEYSKADVKEKERFKSKISRARKRLTEK